MTSQPKTRRSWRFVMWLLVALAGYWLVAGLQEGRAGNDPGLARGLAVSGLCFVLAGWLGVRGVQQGARTQAVAAAHAARMLLVAQLGDQDDATLERIAGSPGPAADAALMILQGRHLGNPAGTSRHTRPES